MTNPVLKTILEKQAIGKFDKKSNTNSDNPYLERVPVLNKHGVVVKYKTRERGVPDSLSDKDKKILKKVRKRAYRWDMGFRCCCFGVRFGWSAIIGLLPVIGDFADLFMALALIKTASNVDGGLPKRMYAMMVTNIMLDLAIGFIPVLGDLADLFYRANTRNAWLLDAYLAEKARYFDAHGINGNSPMVPAELRGDPDNGDLEQGGEQQRAVGSAPVPPAVVTPAQTPAPMRSVAPPSRTGTPGRSLTGQRDPGLPGRKVEDPRDRKGRKG